jgi:RNA polymerase sigma factor (sigma-70 family)
MRADTSGIVLKRIRALWDEGRVGALSDEQLLERLTARGGGAREGAYEAIILRHGPMVLGVCRRVLRGSPEAEDAFQATFLILARRAGAIRRGEHLGGWLVRVAYRVATRARSLAARRGAIVPPESIDPADRPDEHAERDDASAAILGEVQRLPEKYRLPVQLCYLEGRTHDEAAARLAWPVGTVRTRLAWARERLRARLSRRGLALSVGLIDRSLLSLKASSEVPATLVEATLATAGGHAVGTTATTLATGLMRATMTTRLKLASFFVAVGSLAAIALAFAGTRFGHTGPAAVAARGPASDPPATQDRGQDDDPAARAVGTVFFRVVDRTKKQPLAGVTLKVWLDGRVVRQQVTDETGRMMIALPRERFDRLSVTAHKDGLAPMRVALHRGDLADLGIPRSYALAMARSTLIGGIVRDEEGRAIEGVTVRVYEAGRRDRGRESIDLDDVAARSDAQGRWHIDVIPEGFDLADLQFNLSHPAFLSVYDSSTYHPSATPAELRSRSGVTVLHRGVSLAGRVLDRDGHPIAGASVRIGRKYFRDPVRTAADGGFAVPSAPGGESTLVVEADRFAPESRTVRLSAGMPPLEIRLGPGRAIRGKVVDAQGRPVEGAFVAVTHWSGGDSLDWQTQTDGRGRFAWDTAPSDRIWLVAFKQGYRMAHWTVEPTDREAVLKLEPGSPLRIRGVVVDAETGHGIQTFRVVPMVEPSDILKLDEVRTHHGGRYAFDNPQNGQPYRIRIEARGYLPALSPEYPIDGGEQVFNARLSKGRWIEGVVRGLDGRPLAGAEVILVSGNGVHIQGGREYQREHHTHLVTESDGRFEFSPPGFPYRIVVLHEQGYAEASAAALDGGEGVAIEPWGRIEGTLRVGGRTLARETIYVQTEEGRNDPAETRIQMSFHVQTVDRGHFVVDRVPPGEAEAYWMPERHGARGTPDRFYRPAFVPVQPGETARLDIVNEGGRPLIGRIVVPDSKGPPGARQFSAYLVFKSPEVPYPPGLTEPARKEWLARWQLTEPGRAYRRWRRSYGHSLEIQGDGSFRVDEIQPGAYELRVHTGQDPEFIRAFVVPEPAANADRKPVDLGVLTVKKSDPARSGAP